MTVQSRANLNSDHRRHDRLLVTRYAGNDSYPAEKDEAESLVASCSDCAQLAADIRLLAQRTSEMTAPRRPRDFRISAEQAERLRGSWFDRLMRGIAAPGWGSLLRPVAGAAFALGLMLVVVGALPLGAAAPAQSETGRGSSLQAVATSPPAEAPLASLGEEAPAAQPPVGPTSDMAGSPGDNGKAEADPGEFSDVYLVSAQPEEERNLGASPSVADGGSTSQSNLSLVYIGALVALLGAVLLAIVVFARRRYGDALAR